MKKEKSFEFNRKQYLAVRKMDHNEMEQYLNAVYRNGIKAGQQAGQFDTILAVSEIIKLKGVGFKKTEEIYKILLTAGAQDLNEKINEISEELRAIAQGLNN